jgi:tetratricopeptide (TPR) repeat protein
MTGVMTHIGLCALLAVLGSIHLSLERQTPRAAQPAHAPDDLDALKKRADAAREANRLEEAAAVYQQAVRLHPRWIEGHWYLGTISHELGKYAVCQSELRQVVRVQSRNGAAWAIKGLCEFQLKSYTAALDDLTRASKLGVGDDPGIVAVVGYHQAILLARAGQFERAFDVVVGFIRGGNSSPEILDALGIAMLRLPMLPSEVPLDKREMVTLAGRAGSMSMSPNRESGLQLFQQLVSRYPDAPNVHYVYGTALAGDRPDEALEQFKQELSVSPGHALARVQIALELIKRSEYDAAMPYAMQAVRLAPRDFLARKALGQVKLQTGDLAGAIMELEKARALEPSSPSVRYQLSRAYQRAGRTEDASRERAEFTRLEAIQQKQRGAANAVDEVPPEPSPQR